MKLRLPLILIIITLSITAQASGPRWVTGKPFFNNEGNPVIWYTDNPKYFTDPGDLSPSVNHAAADAIVAAAAGVWSVPTARIGLVYGGTLAQHVSSANTYPTSTGIVFPADVQSANYLNIQIAIIYDADGSVTDLMLGSGASSPSGCRQNAVTESVDSFSPAGYILHAILVLNGRCTGPAPEQQLQLQYQLVRAFGRVIGLAWSQTNDNVFTGNPRPTYQQALYWPIMHPIDVICGLYTYQCMPQPFTLRDDDVSGLSMLYKVGWGAPTPPGKIETFNRASAIFGNVTFPSGQGMQGVNIVVHRLEPFWSIPEAWESTSAVSGARFRRQSANPVNGSPTTSTASMGSTNTSLEGYYEIYRVPLYDWEVWQNLVVSTQPINPLYIGAYAVGPYNSNSVDPSGPVATQTFYVTQSDSQETINFPIADAASGCQTTQDGTETSPAPVATSGWWTGNLCTYGHAAWSTLAVKANRSLTVEVTALDTTQPIPTTAKTMPVIGIWNTADPTGTLPTIAAATGAFNSSATGTTTLSTQTTQPRQLRLAIADQRGDGRPDFAYQARILYADSVSPATVPAIGGTVAITGTGFRPGNTVTVNGLPAAVTSWTSNSITAAVPPLHASTAVTATVTVRDLITGGTTTMTSALNYAAPQPTLTLVSAPSGQLFTGSPAPTPFSVKALQEDGLTPIPNTTVTLSVTSGQARLEACGASTCTLTTDINGLASTTVTPLAPGSITLNAASTIGTVAASFTAITRVQTLTPINPTLYLAAGAQLNWTPQVSLTDNAASTVNLPVQWTTLTGPIALNPATSFTDTQSIAQTTAATGPLASNQQATAQACASATPAICTTFTATGVAPAQWQLEILSGAGQSINPTDTLAPVVLRVVDTLGHPIAAAPVAIHQTVEPWTTPPCPDQGRCPIAPTYSSSTTTLTSALDGTVTITPLALPTNPEVTQIAAATGIQGFLSLTLQKHP